MQQRVRCQGLTVTRSGCGLQVRAPANEMKTGIYPGSLHDQMVRDRTHRHAHRIDADSVRSLVRRDERMESRLRSRQLSESRYIRVGSRTSLIGRLVKRRGGTVLLGAGILGEGLLGEWSAI